MIETRDLSRRFGSHEAVVNLDLTLKPGEIYGFLGPNGAGKTTTIRMLCGLLKPTSGTIHIHGFDLSREADKVRAITGFVPDKPPLYEFLTGREYIGFVTSLYRIPLQDRDQRANRYLEELGLLERADSLCQSYSHGMRQKIHLAAVMSTHPKVLFLDEPTNGLDPASARQLKTALIHLRDQGTTVFLSTHLLETAEEICDRVGIMHRGRLCAEGTLRELRAGGDASLEQIFLTLTEEAKQESAPDAAK